MPSEAATIDPKRPADDVGKVRLLTFEHLDRRTRASVRVRELIDEIEEDLGGRARLTAAQRQLVKRASVLGALIEDTETRWCNGEPVDLSGLMVIVNTQRRLLATVGLERKARAEVPDLRTYLASKVSAAPAASPPARAAAPTTAATARADRPDDDDGPEDEA